MFYLHRTELQRVGGSLVAAFIVTTGLFYLMKSLINTAEVTLDHSEGLTVDFVKAIEMEELVIAHTVPVKPPEPEPIPKTPTKKFDTDAGYTEIAIWKEPALKPERGFNPNLAEGTYLPLVKVQPKYPRRALQRGLEGYTIVEYDVGPDGSVRNPKVVEHFPSNIFDNVSIKAALRFRYKPTVENGVAITVQGVQNRFTFEISSG